MIDARTRLLLEDMLANANFASEQIGELPADIFSSTRTLVCAAARAVEIVGEAAAQMDSEVQNAERILKEEAGS